MHGNEIEPQFADLINLYIRNSIVGEKIRIHLPARHTLCNPPALVYRLNHDDHCHIRPRLQRHAAAFNRSLQAQDWQGFRSGNQDAVAPRKCVFGGTNLGKPVLFRFQPLQLVVGTHAPPAANPCGILNGQATRAGLGQPPRRTIGVERPFSHAIFRINHQRQLRHVGNAVSYPLKFIQGKQAQIRISAHRAGSQSSAEHQPVIPAILRHASRHAIEHAGSKYLLVL